MNLPPKLAGVAISVLGALVFALGAGRASMAAEKVIVVPVPGGGHPLAAKTDAAGTIHLVFNTHDGPQYVKSTDEAKSFSKPIAIVDRASRKPRVEFDAWDM